MAMKVAAILSRRTSIVDGAQDVLAAIYSPHTFVGDDEKCGRCGLEKSDKLHLR